MKDTDKARYFCYTHPNLFSQQRCNSCGTGMCHTCIHQHKTLCKDCQRSIYRSSDAFTLRMQGLWILAAGLLTLSLFFGYHHSLDTPNYDINDLLLAFVFGANSLGTFYFFNQTSVLNDIKKIPFIGFKLAIIILALIFITGLPLLYFIFNGYLISIKGRFKNRS